ncbi:unnamed protein product, partial [Symbiodinium necroappetens]
DLESSSSSSEEDDDEFEEESEEEKAEVGVGTTAKAKPPEPPARKEEPPAKKEKKKEKEKDRKRRKESRRSRRRSKDRKRRHRSRSRSRGRHRDRPRASEAARFVSVALQRRPRSPATGPGPTSEQRRPRSPATGPTSEQRAALLRLRLAGSKGGTPVRSRGQRSPTRAASVVSQQHTPTGRAACAVCGRMVSQTAQAVQQHSYSVFHLMAVERAARPGRPEEEYRAAAERRSAEAWGAYYEEGTKASASTKAPSTRRGTQHRGKKKVCAAGRGQGQDLNQRS